MKQEDINGYWIYAETPVTREGVFPYLGRQIDSDGSMGLDPQRRYMVYRPASELTKKSVLESFNGLFLTDEHQMLGKGMKDPGTKRIDGTIYNVHVSPYDKGLVLGTLKVQSQAVKDLISQGKRQLSCGYYCDYVPQHGEFNGIPYDFVQRDIVGNHIALVKKGRMGEKCGVYDSADETEACFRNFVSWCDYGRKESQVRGRGKRQLACDSAIDINQKEVKFMPKDNNYEEMLQKALEGYGVMDKESIDKIIGCINEIQSAKNNPNPAAAEPAKDGSDAPVDQPPAPAPVNVPPVNPDDAATDDDANPPSGPQPAVLTPEEFNSAVKTGVDEALEDMENGRQLAEDAAAIPCGANGETVGNVYQKRFGEKEVANAVCDKLGQSALPPDSKIPFVKALAEQAKNAPRPNPAAPRGAGQDSADYGYTGGHSSVMARYLGK